MTKYCSQKCRARHFSDLGIHFGGPKRTKTRERPCERCHKVFRPSHSHNRFCSPHCAGKSRWEQGDRKFREAGIQKGGHLSLETRRKLSLAASRRPKRNAYSNCKGGFRRDLGHHVRSSWEANICRLLRWFGVSYGYETKVFSLVSGDVGTFYRPDLITRAETIEVKGWWNKRSLMMKKLMQEQHPDVEITYVDVKAYSDIQESFGRDIENWEWGGEKTQRSAEVILNAMEEGKEYAPLDLSAKTRLPAKIASDALQTLKAAGLVRRDRARRGSWSLVRKEVPNEGV